MSDEIQPQNSSHEPKPDPEFERANRTHPLSRIPLWAKITLTALIVFVVGVGFLKNSLNQRAATNEVAASDLDQGPTNGLPGKEGDTITQDRGKAMEGDFVSLDGKPATLTGLRDKVTLVTFWASWCTPCVVELPTFSKVKQEFGDKGLEIVAINLDDEESAAREFIQENWNPAKMPFDSFLDPKRSMMKAFNVETIPSTFVLDRKGRIAMSAVGSQDWGDSKLIESIRQIVNEK